MTTASDAFGFAVYLGKKTGEEKMSLAIFVIECVFFMAAFGALVFGMLFVNPLTFVSDYPPEIQERYYTSQQKEKSQRKLTAAMAGKKGIGLLSAVFLLAWMARRAGAESFVEGLLLAYGYMFVWAVFDTCFLDWALFPNIRRVRLPGTEDMDKEYHQKWFHVKVMLPLLPVFAIGGLAVAEIMVWIW